MPASYRFRTIAFKFLKERAKQNNKVYLIPCGDREYRAMICETPPDSTAIFLTDEGNYPVEVTWTRYDLNLDRIWDDEICQDDIDLIERLNFLGKCGYTVEYLWMYDDRMNTDDALKELFDVCYARIVEETMSVMDEIYDEDQDDMLYGDIYDS